VRSEHAPHTTGLLQTVSPFMKGPAEGYSFSCACQANRELFQIKAAGWVSVGNRT
jgi:hypothetical protein